MEKSSTLETDGLSSVSCRRVSDDVPRPLAPAGLGAWTQQGSRAARPASTEAGSVNEECCDPGSKEEYRRCGQNASRWNWTLGGLNGPLGAVCDALANIPTGRRLHF